MTLINAEELEYNMNVLLEKNHSLIDEWLATRIIDEIKETLPVNAEPIRYGKWIWFYSDGKYHCSECNFIASGYTLECMDGTFKFCPVCGAKLESAEDEELL